MRGFANLNGTERATYDASKYAINEGNLNIVIVKGLNGVKRNVTSQPEGREFRIMIFLEEIAESEDKFSASSGPSSSRKLNSSEDVLMSNEGENNPRNERLQLTFQLNHSVSCHEPQHFRE